jgi:hypothetical protein
MARIRQQRLQAARRASQVLPSHDPRWPDYAHSGIRNDRWPYNLGSARELGSQRHNEVTRVESNTRDPELPSYSTFAGEAILTKKADLVPRDTDAPAITIPQPAYNPSQAEPVRGTSSEVQTPSDPLPFQLPPPPAYILKSEESQEEVSRQDTRLSASDVRGGLPGYEHATNRS